MNFLKIFHALDQDCTYFEFLYQILLHLIISFLFTKMFSDFIKKYIQTHLRYLNKLTVVWYSSLMDLRGFNPVTLQIHPSLIKLTISLAIIHE